MAIENTEIIIYQSADGITKIDVRMDGETLWLSQAQMAELFQTTKQNISLHINNAFEEGEIEPLATVKEYLKVQNEGSREVNRIIKFYNKEQATAFKVYAAQKGKTSNTVLKDYVLKCIDQEVE